MKTFEDVKKSIQTHNTKLYKEAVDNLKQGNLNDYEEKANKIIIKECENCLDNIDEVTAIEIGAQTNSFIDGLRKAYNLHIDEYWNNFENFIDKYVLEVSQGNYRRPKMMMSCAEASHNLGIKYEDIQCFKGQDPRKDEAADMFKQIINDNYGTNIPMSEVRNQAYDDYEKVALSGNKVSEANALIHLKEIQRDDGALKNGLSYYTLATDEDYQEAKRICSVNQIK